MKAFKQENNMPYVPEIGDCIVYNTASRGDVVGYCCGYQVWQSLDDAPGDNGCRLHVRIAEGKGEGCPEVNMRGINAVRPATDAERFHHELNCVPGYDATFVDHLIHMRYLQFRN